jgi:hypothetical protein
MATQNPTVNYAWALPVVGGSADAWGTILNTLLGDDVIGIDAVIKALSDATLSASRLSTGTVALARLPSIPASQITAATFGAGTFVVPGELQLGAYSDVVATVIASTSDASGNARDGTIWCKYTA